jgi:hypothetical protein
MWTSRILAVVVRWSKRIGSILWTKEAAGLACGILCAALLTWLLTEFSELGYVVSADTGYVTVVAVAVLVLALLSGRLTEFSFGGMSAKFNAVAQDPVRSDNISQTGQTLHNFEKGTLTALPDTLARASKYSVAAIELRLPPRSDSPLGNYQENMLLAYAREFFSVVPDSYVIVTSVEGEFIGAVEAGRIAALCVCTPGLSADSYPDLLTKFVEYANRGDKDRLLGLGLLKTATANCGINNKAALRKMQEHNLDFLVLVDEYFAPRRIAIRHQIIEKLLLALAA